MSYGGGPKCARCNKTVYMNEQVFAAGRKWHKACFKCTECNKPLETMTLADHDGHLFCKTCHKRKFANFDMVAPTGRWSATPTVHACVCLCRCVLGCVCVCDSVSRSVCARWDPFVGMGSERADTHSYSQALPPTLSLTIAPDPSLVVIPKYGHISPTTESMGNVVIIFIVSLVRSLVCRGAEI